MRSTTGRASQSSLRKWAILAAALPLVQMRSANACMYHWALGLPEPTGVWPSATVAAPATASAAIEALNTADALNDAAVTAAVQAFAPADSASPPIDTYVTSWMLNTTGATGHSTNTTINNAIKSIPANIQQVRYTATNVYIQATGIPDYNIGPFPGNPNVPANDNATFDIPRNPTPATGTHTATGLGAIGVLVNGVDIFNMSDAMQYNSSWHNNAGVVEAPSFDAAKAHPQQQGVYHNHENPTSLIAELAASSTNPKVLGYALDGYPILNDYASTTPGGPILKMDSGYQLRTYAGNVRPNSGPAVGGQYVDGYFQEDYQYVAGQSLPSTEFELDQYNGAFVYTPQFPNGTYAYFATTDSSGNAAYPYLVGPNYYGTPAADDLSGTIVVPSNSVIYTVPEPASLALVAVAMLPLLRRRR